MCVLCVCVRGLLSKHVPRVFGCTQPGNTAESDIRSAGAIFLHAHSHKSRKARNLTDAE